MNINTAQRYLAGSMSAAELFEYERTLTSGPDELVDLASASDQQRVSESRRAIFAELDTPMPSRTERAIRRLGLSETTARLVAATPTFRRSFVIVIIAMVFFTAASANSTEGVNRLLTFLTLAPALPLLGTAWAFGPSSDPMHEVTSSTPMHGFRLVLIRTSAAYVASIAALVPGSLFITEIGPWRWAWLLPGLALTTTALALSTRVATHIASAAVGLSWLGLVTTVAVSTTDDVVLFRGQGQLVALAVSLVTAGIVYTQRNTFERADLT